MSSWPTEITQLISEVDQLTAAVNVKKSSLDQIVVNAQNSSLLAANSAIAAANSAAAALASFQTAEGHKNTAVGVYGSLAAQQTALANAQNASMNASFAADSASSIQQQNLSGINVAALHRSPNAITSMFIYDTSKDSDGGAWTEKCQHTSWYNEPIMGKWLGAQASETLARIAGATMGAQLVANGDFSGGTTGWTATSGTFTVENGRARVVGANGRANGSAFATVVGRTYEVIATIVSSTATSFINARRGDTNASLASVNSIGEQRFIFTAASTTSYISIDNGGTAGTDAVFDNVSVREVTAITTASGDYYQSTADGRFYRLWKNLLSSSRDPFTSSSVVAKADAGVNAPTGDQYVRITELAGTGPGKRFFNQTLTTIAGRMVFSFYAKENVGGRWISFRENTTTGFAFDFQPSTGAVANYGGSASASNVFVETVSAGVYRVSCAIDFTSAASRSISLDIRPGAGQSSIYVGDNVSGFDVTSVQLEAGSTSSTYELKASGVGSVSEVFRGNKRDFPRLAGIVAETNGITVYDLTERGVNGSFPMWKSFRTHNHAIAASYEHTLFISRGTLASTVCLAGLVCVGSTNAGGGNPANGGGLHVFDFPLDRIYSRIGNYGGDTGRMIAMHEYASVASNGVAHRHNLPSIANIAVNAVAATVLPDAPVDPVTGLRVPTIAVATAGGVSVIRQDGVVRNSSSTSAFQQVAFSRGNLVWSGIVTEPVLSRRVTSDLPAAFIPDQFYRRDTGEVIDAFPRVGNSNSGSNLVRQMLNGVVIAHTGGPLAHLLVQGTKINDVRSRGLVAKVSNTFNTGWMTGDIRRTYLSDTVVGSVTGGELVTDGSFSSGVGDWQAGTGTTVTNEGGELRLQPSSSFKGAYLNVAVAVGITYRVRLSVRVSGVNSGFIRIGSNAYTADMAWNGSYLDTNTNTNNSVRTVDMLIVATSPTLGIGVICSTGVFDLYVDNVSVAAVAQDRSYKAARASITGTITRSQLASGTSLVGYSGFSADNYLREPYSADLDFGTGEWTASAWVNYSHGNPNANLRANPEVASGMSALIVQSDVETAPNGTLTADKIVATATNDVHFGGGSFTNTSSSFVVSIYAKKGEYDYLTLGGGSGDWFGWARAIFDLNLGRCKVLSGFPYGTVSNPTMVDVFGDGSWWRCSVIVSGGNIFYYGPNPTYDQTGSGSFTGDGVSGVFIWGVMINQGTAPGVYTPGQTVVYNPRPGARIVSRGHASGPFIDLSVDGYGYLTATAFDGTTTRIVTTSAAYNTGQWLKACVNYTTDGTLAILVNGREVATTRGNPLLTLNNSNAVLTIGNSFVLDAPFPGSIALLKLGATVPTPEQETFIYEQEKQLFRANAASVLPDSNPIVDMSYDDTTDRWVALSSTNESYWTGLVRNSVTPVPAGSYSRIATTSGIELTARTTTNPGVDVTIPEYILREELLKRSEPQSRLNRQVATFDYVGGFTGNITTGSTAIASVTNLTYPVSYIGARVNGTGIPANTTITGVSGTTIYISAPATATTTGASITFQDFELPVGYTAEMVSSSGIVRREGSTADYTRLFDGFIETIRFAVDPGATAHVQIKASRPIS
jgi:hypothetical protein